MQLKRYGQPDYSRKLIFYSKEQLFYCYDALRLKKKDQIADFRYLEVLERFPNSSRKNLNKEPSHLAFFTALDLTEYWGMIREWVYLFLRTVK